MNFELEQLLLFTVIVSLGNIGILGVITSDCAKMYSKTKAQLPIGLGFFSLLLMVQNLIAVYSYFSMEYYFSQEVIPYLFYIQLAELGGLAMFLKITH